MCHLHSTKPRALTAWMLTLTVALTASGVCLTTGTAEAQRYRRQRPCTSCGDTQGGCRSCTPGGGYYAAPGGDPGAMASPHAHYGVPGQSGHLPPEGQPGAGLDATDQLGQQDQFGQQMDPFAAQAQPQAPGDFFAPADTSPTAAQSAAPNMIGDFFGGGAMLSSIHGSHGTVSVAVPSPSGGVVGRIKLAENNNTLPQDRIFFNYSGFKNVPLSPSNVTVQRFTPGVEKTFLQGMASFQIQAPMAATLDSDLIADNGFDAENTEFGNVTVMLKLLLLENYCWSLGTGLGVTVPTADDIHVDLADGTQLVRIQNDSVHLMPFFTAAYTPNDVFFAQGFLQFDFDANGNVVQVDDGGPLARAGKAQDPHFVFVDLAAGAWLYRHQFDRIVTGIAPTIEAHYNRTLQDTDVITSGATRIGSFADDLEVLNVVAGCTFEVGTSTTVTAGYAFPIGAEADRQFDGEGRLFINRFF